MTHSQAVRSTLNLLRLPLCVLKSPGWFAAVVVLVDVNLILAVLVAGHATWYEEDALIENAQAGAMVFAAIILATALPRVAGFDRWLIMVYGLTCFAFFLREVDVEDQNVPRIFILLGSGAGRDLLISLAYVALGIRFLRRFRTRMKELPLILRTRVAQIVILGCVFLTLGSVAETFDYTFWEELMELNGALLILWGAILCFKDPHQLTRERSPVVGESLA